MFKRRTLGTLAIALCVMLVIVFTPFIPSYRTAMAYDPFAAMTERAVVSPEASRARSQDTGQSMDSIELSRDFIVGGAAIA